MLDTALFVNRIPFDVTGLNPSHCHDRLAKGLPPMISHVKITLLSSKIGPLGVCVINGNDSGGSSNHRKKCEVK